MRLMPGVLSLLIYEAREVEGKLSRLTRLMPPENCLHRECADWDEDRLSRLTRLMQQ